jgi:FtsP/CotA-like multicopper oxidase with cupredoxin domain
MRFLMIKDAQIKATENGGFVFRGASDTALCSQTPPGMGFWPNGECVGDGGFHWIFTVNGVQKPRIGADNQPGEAELWRIANASPTVSYHLSLAPLAEVEAAGPDGPLSRTSFFMLAKDGAGLPATDGQAPQEKELLLMPGARVEILIPPLEAKTYALVSEGLQTGGDAWPRVVLAIVEGKGAGPTAQAVAATSAPLGPTTSGPDINRATAPSAAAATPPSRPLDEVKACDRLAGRERLILFVKNPTFFDGDKVWDRGDLLGLIAGVRERGQRDPDKARYFARPTGSTPLGQMEPHTLAELRPWLTKGFDQTAPNFIPAFGNPPTLSNICANFDPDGAAYEDWVLENWSNEIHNFHIHQTRFTIAPHAVADESYFSFPCAKAAYVTDPANPDYIADKPCWLDETKDGDSQTGFGDELIAQFYRGHLSTGVDSRVQHDAAHDSAPLPRGTTVCDGHIWSNQEIDAAIADNRPACRPGRATVRIRFNRREQIGAYVYHCHILEHEDRGMMGLIEVHDRGAQSAEDDGQRRASTRRFH